ncbi:hypothetical protein [Paraburkholderia dinghuensis]|uniref:Uncharacterized protein n=1 Tax=Paraburkholderia dinghuensis TaxID=2305225 RepID=A0A3N6MSF5_9BURK|nr:hypothetical protein [Paraburkholderia dinghuensis]RQH06609.1 hypothetical protein D1Y85_12110 [Paraburkholderia dinghuensis]
MSNSNAINWPQATDSELTRIYRMLGAQEDKLNQTLKRIKATKGDIETEMLARMQRRNSDGFRTADATVTRSKNVMVSCASEGWPKFYGWLLSEADRLKTASADPTQVFAYLHKRVTKETVQAYMAANNGRVPPSITVLSEYAVSVRRRAAEAAKAAA